MASDLAGEGADGLFRSEGNTPRTDEEAFLREPWEVDTAADLPATLFIGSRDDESFAREGEGWQCLYRCEGEPFLQLRGVGEQWQLTKLWQGKRIGGGFAEGTLLEALKQSVFYGSLKAAEDPWEGLFKARVESLANAQYQTPEKGDPVVESIPDGRFKGLVVPIAPAVGEMLAGRLDWFRRNLQARAVLARGERVFQIVSPQPLSAEAAEQLAAEIAAAYEQPPGTYAVSFAETAEGGLWRLQIRQELALAYFLFPWRQTIPLAVVLREGRILAPPADPAASTELLLRGALVVGDYRLLGRMAIVCHKPWLADMPAAVGAFPTAPKELFH